MIPFKRILHPTDFSNSARAALPIACALARDYEATLVLLHVRDTPTPAIGEFGALPLDAPESDESVHSRLRQLLPPGYAGKVDCLARTGDVTQGILDAATQGRCDMIVLGTHGRSGLGRLFLGSVAEAVLRSATCPVLTVKPTVPAKAGETERAEAAVNADNLATVYTVSNAVEAEMIKNALANEGIRCTLESPTQGGIAGMMAFPVKVQVRAGDADRAARFLRQHEAAVRK